MPGDCWQPVYVGLGSNLADPRAQVLAARQRLVELDDVDAVCCSPLYSSPPMGPTDQPDYVNAVVGMLCRSTPQRLLEQLKGLEQALGREANPVRWGPRIIDLDILVFGAVTMDEPGLKLPHPGVSMREFVLRPLADIAPTLEVPGHGRVDNLLARLPTDAVCRRND